MSSLAEYESQLSEIEGMLVSSPEDPSLLSLKADLLELIAATIETQEGQAEAQEAAKESSQEEKQEQATTAIAATVSEWNTVNETRPIPSNTFADAATTAKEAETVATETVAATTTTDATDKSTEKKKKAKSSTKVNNGVFTVPANLEIRPTDSKFEVQRKKRATATLRKQHQAQQETAAATAKQQSWQAFANKKTKKTSKNKKSGSIFQTDATGKVGVVGQRRLTKFEGPKKHTY